MEIDSIYLFTLLISASQCWRQPSAPSLRDKCCPPNSHFVEGGVCAPSCDTANKIERVCNVMQILNCVCDDDYILPSNYSANCIPAIKCKVSCPPNMHYDPKASGCEPKYTQFPELFFCPEKTRPQCVCNMGYIFCDNACVTEEECKMLLGIE